MSHHSFSMGLKGAQYQSQVWRLRKYTGCDSNHCQVTPPHHLQQYGFNSIKLCPDLGPWYWLGLKAKLFVTNLKLILVLTNHSSDAKQ